MLDTVVKLVQTQEAALKEEDVEDVPHPLDRAYQLLGCQLQLLDPEEPEYEVGRAPWRSRARSGHRPSAHLPSGCPEECLPHGLLSLCLSGLRTALGLGGPVGVHPHVLSSAPSFCSPHR